MAASYNPGLKRYLLTTMTIDRVGRFSLYSADEPWGPWELVFEETNTNRWGRKCIAFSFVNKWLSNDGKDFVIIHTKSDTLSSIEGRFLV